MSILPLRRASGKLALPKTPPDSSVSPADPAATVFTDFAKTAVFSIVEDTGIDQTLLYMKAVGVRFLFVTNAENSLVGLVTTTDIQGEKPLRHIQATGVTRAEILVRHVMTPVSQWEVIDYAEVEKAKVSQVVDCFKAVGRRHLVVVENALVRGIFSATRVERSLGIRLDIVGRARSFAEIENALMH
ncbi:MAG TPA: CBS domain-containing protein [Burkholderiales bacterium]|nr:CBS domain-containing protein [Burkholderiales bacterium]